MLTSSVISGRGSPRTMVWSPPPSMSNRMVSAPAVALACWMAARRVHWSPSVSGSTSHLSSVVSSSSSSVVSVTMSAPGRTVVSSSAVLSARSGSGPDAVASARLVIVPTMVGVTTTSTVAFAPLPMSPSMQVTTPVLSAQLPWDGVADTKVTSAGRVSTSSTELAVSGPSLVTVTV